MVRRKKAIKGPRDEKFRCKGTRQSGTPARQGVTQWVLVEGRSGLGGKVGVDSHRAETWGWEQRQTDTYHTDQRPRQLDCAFLTQLIDDR